MKKAITLLVLFFSIHISNAQPMVLEWQQCFGEQYMDDARDVCATGDGYIFAGSREIGFNSHDLWLIRMDLEGNPLWEKFLGGTGSETPYRIFPTGDGNFYIAASATSSDGDISNDPYPRVLNYWIVKINGDGDILWEKIYGGNCKDYVWDATLTHDGGMVTLGYTCSSDGDVSNYIGTWDTWLLKTDSQGNKVWDFCMGTLDFDVSSSIIQTSDYGFLVASSSTPTTGGNIDCIPFNHNADIVLFKLDSVANIEWQQCFGGSHHESVFDMIETSDGYLLACTAYTNDGDITGAGYHYGTDLFGHAMPDIWLVKLDFEGNFVWHKCYGGSHADVPYRVFHSGDGGYIVFGETRSFNGDVSGNHSNSSSYSDIWVIKITSDGELLWQKCFGGGGNSRIDWSGVVSNGDGSYVIASSLLSLNDGDVTCQTSTDNWNVWLIKVRDTSFVNTGVHQPSSPKVSVYPNPANEYVVFETQKPYAGGTILITDITGRHVASLPLTGEKTVWQTGGMEAGVFLYRVKAGNMVTTGKLMLAK